VGTARREAGAAASALGAYLTTVLPRARRELKRLGPLPPEKVKNAEAVAVFATLAPPEHRPTVVRAIVALQVQIDLRDELEEAAGEDSEAPPVLADRLEHLEIDWRLALAHLPAQGILLPHVNQAVNRCRQGQLRTHRAAREGDEPLRQWAAELEMDGDYRWWEAAAGASSSVAAHALIAAAADPYTTEVAAESIDAAYQPSIGALTVFLDDLVDRDQDLANGEHNYLAYYESPEAAADRLAAIADHAETLIGRLPESSRHRAILSGVAAYYLSAAAAETPHALPIRERLLATLGPGGRLLAAFMRLRRLGERKRPGQAGNPPGP
jgi:tetraprenyl-beta-curcumene synthase